MTTYMGDFWEQYPASTVTHELITVNNRVDSIGGPPIITGTAKLEGVTFNTSGDPGSCQLLEYNVGMPFAQYVLVHFDAVPSLPDGKVGFYCVISGVTLDGAQAALSGAGTALIETTASWIGDSQRPVIGSESDVQVAVCTQTYPNPVINGTGDLEIVVVCMIVYY